MAQSGVTHHSQKRVAIQLRFFKKKVLLTSFFKETHHTTIAHVKCCFNKKTHAPIDELDQGERSATQH